MSVSKTSARGGETDGAVVERLRSEGAIRELISNYCRGVDRRDASRFLQVWHEDAVWVGPGDGESVGLEAIEARIEKTWSQSALTHHLTSNVVVEIAGDTATALSDTIAAAIKVDGSATTVFASYHDEFERRAGVWKFARRRTEIRHVANA